jgi:surfeit locus 1 family protein
MLILALLVAAIFAVLSQWQLSRAVVNSTTDVQVTEQRMPISQLTSPGQPVYEKDEGQEVSVIGHFEPGDYSIAAQRLNHGESGYWVIGHVTVDAPGNPALAVALGWTADRDTAVRTVADLSSQPVTTVAIDGRYLGTDAPNVNDAENAKGEAWDPTSVSLAELVNTWTALDPQALVYGGYILAAIAPSGLEVISAPPPDASVQLNWLNIFYAIEWVVFAGFAVFLWYRLVKDAWERETEEAAEAEAARLAAEQPADEAADAEASNDAESSRLGAIH